MKYVHTLFFLLFSLALQSQVRLHSDTAGIAKAMQDEEVNWIHFDSITAAGMSSSFKKEMTIQLKYRLYAMLHDSVSETEFRFSLDIGVPSYLIGKQPVATSPTLEITTRDGFSFMQAILHSTFARIYPITIAWNTADTLLLPKVHQSNVTEQDVRFYFCNSLPKTEIIRDLSPHRVLTPQSTGYKFSTSFYLTLFPDVMLWFRFSEEPGKKSLKELEKEVLAFSTKYNTGFVHDLLKMGNWYTIALSYNNIDFSTYSHKDMLIDMAHMHELLKKLNKNKHLANLKEVKFQ